MGRKGGGLGTTLVLALVIVVLGLALGVGLARYGSTLPVVGSLLERSRRVRRRGRWWSKGYRSSTSSLRCAGPSLSP